MTTSNKELILSSIEAKTPVKIHLVSGEFYMGTCERTEDHNKFIIDSSDKRLLIPYWSVKRLNPLDLKKSAGR